MTNEKSRMHRLICEKLNQLFEINENDYNKNFTITRKEFNSVILVRLFENYLELKNLFKENEKEECDENFEAIAELLGNIANDCITELIEMQLEANEQMKSMQNDKTINHVGSGDIIINNQGGGILETGVVDAEVKEKKMGF